jgi:hypothetical protein
MPELSPAVNVFPLALGHTPFAAPNDVQGM